jgi:hypothetical protein
MIGLGNPYALLAGGALAIALLTGAYFKGRSAGHENGVQATTLKLQPKIDALTEQRNACLAVNQSFEAAVKRQNDAVLEAQEKARDQAVRAAQAIKQATDAARTHEANALWLSDLRLREQRDTSCDAGLKIVRERLGG